MLPDRFELSRAEVRVEKIKCGSVGVAELIQKDRTPAHSEPKSAILNLIVSRS